MKKKIFIYFLHSIGNGSTEVGKEPAVKMRKQESYLMAVGELSPEEHTLQFGSKLNHQSNPRIKKQDSYLQAIGNVEDDMLTPLPLRSTGVRKQESYQRAVLAGGVGSFTTGILLRNISYKISRKKL